MQVWLHEKRHFIHKRQYFQIVKSVNLLLPAQSWLGQLRWEILTHAQFITLTTHAPLTCQPAYTGTSSSRKPTAPIQQQQHLAVYSPAQRRRLVARDNQNTANFSKVQRLSFVEHHSYTISNLKKLSLSQLFVFRIIWTPWEDSTNPNNLSMAISG